MHRAFACCIVMETRHKLILVQAAGGSSSIAILLVQGIVQVRRSICHDQFLHEILFHDVLERIEGSVGLVRVKMKFHAVAGRLSIGDSRNFHWLQLQCSVR